MGFEVLTDRVLAKSLISIDINVTVFREDPKTIFEEGDDLQVGGYPLSTRGEVGETLLVFLLNVPVKCDNEHAH